MIAKYLELSTRHIKKETIEGLSPDKWPYSYRYEEGVFITVDELFHPQLGVKTLLDGGRRRTKNLYGVVKRTVPAGQVRQ